MDSRVIFLFFSLFIVVNNYNYKNNGRRYRLSENRGTQRICSSQYLFYRENFAGWELRFRLFSWEVKSIDSTVKNLSNVSKILAGGILSL